MKKIKFDQLIFYLAIFFMPSAFFISAIFLFINLVISLFKYGNEFLMISGIIPSLFHQY